MKKILVSFIIILVFSCDKEDVKPANCSLEPEAGDCEAAIKRYYFDQTMGICKEFLWGGCGGVVPFETLEECKACECNEVD